MSKLEYLDENYKLHVIDAESEAVPEGWILVPDGGEKLAICNGFQSFWKNDAVLFLGIDNDWDYGYMSFNDYCEANNNDPEILWQRESKSEAVDKKHNHYFKDVRHLNVLDVYRVLDLFAVEHPCIQHAVKKLLCAGQRGSKNRDKDVQEAIDSLVRFQEMRKEDK